MLPKPFGVLTEEMLMARALEWNLLDEKADRPVAEVEFPITFVTDIVHLVQCVIVALEGEAR